MSFVSYFVLDTVEKYMGIKNGKMNNMIIYNLAVTTQTLHPSKPKLLVANRAGTGQIVLAFSVPILTVAILRHGYRLCHPKI